MLEENSKNTLRYMPGLCTGCGMCGIVCPHGVFSNQFLPARLASPEKCIECGACRINCPAGAILVETGPGCAWAMIKQALTGGKKSSCSGSGRPCC